MISIQGGNVFVGLEGGTMFSVAHQENQGTSAMRLRHDVGTCFNKGFGCCVVG